MQRKFVGIDGGNDSLKEFDGQTLVLQNIWCPGLEREVGPDNDRKSPDEALDLEIVSDNLPNGGGHWFFGRLAALPQNAELASEMGTEGKWQSEQVHALIVAGLARLALEQLPPGENGITYQGVASLPVRQWADHYKEFQTKLRGVYLVDFKTTPRARKRTITINLERVRVLPEGLSAVYNQVYDDHLRVADPEAEQGVVGVVDLGGRTADLPVVTGMVYDSDRSAGEDLGANVYMDLIRREVQRTHSDSDLLANRAQLVDLLKQRRPDGRVLALQAGADRDITDIVDKYADLYAGRAAGLIRKHWAKNSDIRTLRIVGGGALLVSPFLEAHLNPPGTERRYRLSWAEEPQLQLAQGNYKCARLMFGGSV